MNRRADGTASPHADSTSPLMPGPCGVPSLSGRSAPCPRPPPRRLIAAREPCPASRYSPLARPQLSACGRMTRPHRAGGAWSAVTMHLWTAIDHAHTRKRSQFGTDAAPLCPMRWRSTGHSGFQEQLGLSKGGQVRVRLLVSFVEVV